MVHKECHLNIEKETTCIKLIKYETQDLYLFQELYTNWMMLNEKIAALGGRPTQLPSDFVESLVAYMMDYYKVNDNYLGFDCYDPNANQGNNYIEIKYGTGRADFSSFSPQIKWNRLNFVKFYNESPTNCYFEIYDINIDTIIKNSESFRNCFLNNCRLRPHINITKELIEKGLFEAKYSFSLF